MIRFKKGDKVLVKIFDDKLTSNNKIKRQIKILLKCTFIKYYNKYNHEDHAIVQIDDIIVVSNDFYKKYKINQIVSFNIRTISIFDIEEWTLLKIRNF